MAPNTSDTDPRLDPGSEGDIRPTVRTPPQGVSGAVIAGGAVIAALLLFGVLDARRRTASAPTVNARVAELPGSAAPPPLYVPPAPLPYVVQPPVPVPAIPARVQVTPPSPPPVPQVVYAPSAQVVPPVVPVEHPRTASGAALVIDNDGPAVNDNRPVPGNGQPGLTSTTGSSPRVYASMIANRSATVPQGTLIPAVLETAFDSTRPGFARALVQRDVHGFDGSAILIPRGSRLIGEYGADTSAGQNRAVIAWTRLIRPDGVSIALASPAADPVGRGGIKASVNSHFLARFAGAILQSVLDVGVNLASRSSNSPVIVALPGSVGTNANQFIQPRQIPPTLSVKQGKSISVFVARDLDFSDVERDR